jgi:hypothetical protein
MTKGKGKTIQTLLIPRSALDDVAKRDEIQNVGK